MRHEWPAPDSLEHVRADAILRQLPALLEEAGRLPDGVVEAVVSDKDVRASDGESHGEGRGGECASHWFEISEGRLEALDEPAEEATARVRGDEAAWIAALGPGGDCSGLHFAGKRTIVKCMLDSLPRDNCL
jgi:hypothetical protein